MIRSEQTGQANVREAASDLLRGALRHTQAARLAAALVPLAAVPLTLTDGLSGPQAAFAQSGGSPLLQTVAIPTDAQCPAGSGTASGRALAVVAGGKVGVPQSKSLLVTSCNDNSGEIGQSRLYFTDPRTGTRVTLPGNKSFLTTIPSPAGGWDALAFRIDRGDLLACTNSGPNPGVYRIDISPFNTTVDGTAVQMGAFPSFGDPDGGLTVTTCAGIGWDHVSKQVYQIDGGEGSVHTRYSLPETGTLPPSKLEVFRPGSCASFRTNGVAVAGPSVFVSCFDGPEINWLSKNNDIDPGPGIRLENFLTLPITFPYTPGDLECDPITFKLEANNSAEVSNSDAVWVKNGDAADVRAIAVTSGVCSLGTTLPVAEPAACPANWTGSPDADNDQDGLLDCWEDGTLWPDGLPGIDFDGDGTRDFVLCVPNPPTNDVVTECAQLDRKDLFLEIDYMGNPTTTSHRPNADAISDVQAAFQAAPVANARPATDPWATGIRLHVHVDDVDGPTIDHKNRTILLPCTVAGNANDADFDVIKAAKFGTPVDRADVNRLNARRFVFHWMLFGHNQAPDPSAPTGQAGSGCAEVFGNDSLVSMGNFAADPVTGHSVGSRKQQAATLMHELGHNLSLRHGGGDNINCKPNYISVMNYIFQFDGPVNTGRNVNVEPNNRWRLDYSRSRLIDLQEGALNEGVGIGTFTAPLGASNDWVVFGPATISTPPTAAQVTSGGVVNWNRSAPSTQTVSIPNLNTFNIGGCSAVAGAQTLVAFDDWANLQFNFRASLDFADGAHESIEESKDGGSTEMSQEDVVQISPSSVIDVVPGDRQNRLLKGLPVLPVAILGSDLIEARNVDPSSATLTIDGNLTARVQRVLGKPACLLLDVNRDGEKKKDLVCAFDVSRLNLALGEHQLELNATTFDGTAIRSGDTFRVIQLKTNADP